MYLPHVIRKVCLAGKRLGVVLFRRCQFEELRISVLMAAKVRTHRPLVPAVRGTSDTVSYFDVVVTPKMLCQVFWALEAIISSVAFAVGTGICRMPWLIFSQVPLENVDSRELYAALASVRPVLELPCMAAELSIALEHLMAFVTHLGRVWPDITMIIRVRNMDFEQVFSLSTQVGKGSIALIIGTLIDAMVFPFRMPLEMPLRHCFILTDLADTAS